MITDNPLNDAIDYINKQDAIEDEIELKCCHCCLDKFAICELQTFEGHNYCPQCLNEIKNENQ
jgi:hypothetical protein